MRRGRVASVAAVVALAALLMLTGCTRSLPADSIEQELERQLSTEGFVPDVTCDDDLRGEVGSTITCQSTLADGVEVELTVTTTEVDGDQVRYDFQISPDNVDELGPTGRSTPPDESAPPS